MKRLNNIILFLILLPLAGWSQEELVLNSGYMVMANGTAAAPTYLVIHNGLNSGIVRNAGGIISESEYNMVWWDIGTNNATYTVPFQYSTTSYIPLTMQITTVGVSSGTFKFSTWHGTLSNCNGNGVDIADNDCYMPSDVTNMFPATATSSPSATNNSYNVVDRFWVLDANTGYTTKPDAKLTFTYLNSTNGNSEVAAPNAAIDGTLLAQRFNSTLKSWGDYLGQSGTTVAAGTTSTVTTGTVDFTAAGFFRSWTLSNKSAPLPITLESFAAKCDNSAAVIQWSTATETNNNYFTVHKTQDGVNYVFVDSVKGAGNSTTTQNYSVIDYTPYAGTSYYRLSQTDFDGNTTYFNDIPFTSCQGDGQVTFNAYNSNGLVNVDITTPASGTYTIQLFNDIGQLILSKEVTASIGFNETKINPEVSNGVYILHIENEKNTFCKKLLLVK